ncbi:MAG TPA: PHP domain-containing protein [Thermomicrobiales bacterium]|nr:PHP domain-containing protein [Thermomicrobiales bacterium]
MTAAAPLPADAPLDLHLHTRVSDGDWTPETLVAHLAARGFRVAAVADHDAIDAVAPATALAAAHGLAIVPAVEVTTRWDGRQWHLLVYGAGLDGTPFRALVDEQRRRHVAAAERAVAALAAAGHAVPSLGAEIGDRPPLPIYVMKALVRAGLAPDLLAANALVTGLGVPFYIDVPLREAVETAHAAGGVAVLAHPGRPEPETLTEERFERMLREAPLDGLEVHYPTHTDGQRALYDRLAARHGLLRSAGSDSHGPDRPRAPLAYPAALVAPLLARCGLRVAVGEG